jgi:hypothetical protein
LSLYSKTHGTIQNIRLIKCRVRIIDLPHSEENGAEFENIKDLDDHLKEPEAAPRKNGFIGLVQAQRSEKAAMESVSATYTSGHAGCSRTVKV